MVQLQQLDGCKAPFTALPKVQDIGSPLVVERWTVLLQTHSDKDLVTYILQASQRAFTLAMITRRPREQQATCLQHITTKRWSQDIFK